MVSILITPAAENDLVNIWLYIARDNQDAADRVYQAAEKTFESLLAAPRMGTLYQAKRPQLEGMRFFPISSRSRFEAKSSINLIFVPSVMNLSQNQTI